MSSVFPTLYHPRRLPVECLPCSGYPTGLYRDILVYSVLSVAFLLILNFLPHRPSASFLTITKNISYSNYPSHLMLLTFQCRLCNQEKSTKTLPGSLSITIAAVNYISLSPAPPPPQLKTPQLCDCLKLLKSQTTRLIYRWDKSLLSLLFSGSALWKLGKWDWFVSGLQAG